MKMSLYALALPINNLIICAENERMRYCMVSDPIFKNTFLMSILAIKAKNKRSRVRNRKLNQLKK